PPCPASPPKRFCGSAVLRFCAANARAAGTRARSRRWPKEGRRTVAMPQRPPNEPDKISPRQVAAHFTMGAVLGTLASLYLVLHDSSAVHHLLSAGAAPPTPVAVFVVMWAGTVAIGASLTGIIFSTIEAEQRAASRRRPPHGRD